MDIKKAREELRKGQTIYQMPLNVVYYARVSTDKDDQLNSLENQQNYFKEMINDNKCWNFAGAYIDEGISGTAVKNRDRFMQMIADSKAGRIDLILTKEISRFSRNTVDSIRYTEFLLKNGVIVYFLSDNLNTISEDAEFRLTIMSSLAQDEVRKLSERVKFGIKRMVKDGKLIGGGLTGYYKKNGKYEINENEKPIIEYLFTTYVTGQSGLRKIGEELARMGYLNSKGKVFSDTTLRKMLTNPRYKGYYTANMSRVDDYKTHKKTILPEDEWIVYKDDRIPAIVSEELWDKANELHEKRKKLSSRHIMNDQDHLENYKYSSKLYCGDCDSIFIRCAGSNRKDNPSWSCKTYKVNGVKICASPILYEKQLDRIFIDIISDFMKNKKEYLKEVISEYESEFKKYNDDINLDSIKEKITKQEILKDKLLELSLNGLISNDEFKERNEKFNIELSALKSELQEKELSGKSIDIFKEKIETLEKALKPNLDVKNNLASLVKILIDRVEVTKINNDRKKIHLNIIFDFNASPVEIEMDLNKKEKTLCSCEIEQEVLKVKNFAPKCSCTTQKQPRFRFIRTKIR